MLILTRKTAQSIIIGDVIAITVLSVKGGQVRIGVECPKDIPVHRHEIHSKIMLELGKEPFDLQYNAAKSYDKYNNSNNSGFNNRSFNNGSASSANNSNSLTTKEDNARLDNARLTPNKLNERDSRQPRCNRSDAEQKLMP